MARGGANSLNDVLMMELRALCTRLERLLSGWTHRPLPRSAINSRGNDGDDADSIVVEDKWTWSSSEDVEVVNHESMLIV